MKKEMKKMANKAVKKHEKDHHGMMKGGKVMKDGYMKGGKVMKSGYKKGGKVKMRGTGCAKRGIYSRGPMG